MIPLIHSRDEVVVSPVDPTRVEVGDIVLTKVAGSIYIHLVKAIEPAKRRVQIGNNRGGINGWTGFDRVYGKRSRWPELNGREQGQKSFRGTRKTQ
jgi:hypothetical protein